MSTWKDLRFHWSNRWWCSWRWTFPSDRFPTGNERRSATKTFLRSDESFRSDWANWQRWSIASPANSNRNNGWGDASPIPKRDKHLVLIGGNEVKLNRLFRRSNVESPIDSSFDVRRTSSSHEDFSILMFDQLAMGSKTLTLLRADSAWRSPLFRIAESFAKSLRPYFPSVVDKRWILAADELPSNRHRSTSSRVESWFYLDFVGVDVILHSVFTS